MQQGWYFTVGSPEAETCGSTPPTYPTQYNTWDHYQATVKVHGVFPSCCGTWYLHHNFNFTESPVETLVQ